ncbi:MULTISPECIES: hypothetical protein [unclassified Streptomyces]|uniref:hypothetical protein n=1 Tax=unclassified Streptomyces TaxID=2593676 RepID=UPI00190699D6|nr:hypothetical protein [Streptomyces sp. HSG2]
MESQLPTTPLAESDHGWSLKGATVVTITPSVVAAGVACFIGAAIGSAAGFIATAAVTEATGS